MKAIQNFIKKLKQIVQASAKKQQGWTTMEYVVGAIALVGIVTLVLNAFGDKLISAIGSLQIVQ